MRLDSNSNEDFKSFDFKYDKINLENLATWGGLEKTDTRLPITDYASLGGPRYNRSPFPLVKEINNRFVIWDGDITKLDVDAITNTTHESLTESNLTAERILIGAGNQLKDELSNHIKVCQTGEVRVTKGYDLAAKYILHTVAPTLKDKFKSAAENSLHCCYRNVLHKARELKLRTIAVSAISTGQRNFPPDFGAHIALRTIRRFLDRATSQVVILCVAPHERGIYEVLAPLYFPRDQLEERSALWQLPKDIGGEFGEPQHLDRQIRIIRNPQHSVMLRHTDDESDNSPHDMEGAGSDLECGFSELNGLSLNSHTMGSQSYAQMQGDLDRQRLLGDRPRNGIYESVIADGVEGLEHQQRDTGNADL